MNQLSQILYSLLERLTHVYQSVSFKTTGDAFLVHLLSPGPADCLILFAITSFLMIWRLNAIEQKGFEGTLTGTLIMPYCSGFANLAFAFVLGKSAGNGRLVLENCSVNNMTNLTLVLGLSSLFWGTASLKHTEKDTTHPHVSYFSMILSIAALLFFTGLVGVLADDSVIERSDGLILVGVFVFWQVIHVIDVMKNNALKKRSFNSSVLLDFCLIIACAWVMLHSIDTLVAWVSVHGKGFLSMKYLGFISGILMVIPNGLLAVYYAIRRKPDIAFSSQVGDCHICIPLCIGLYALFSPIHVPPSFLPALIMIAAAGLINGVFLVSGRIPRLVGGGLIAGYGVFLYFGIPG